MGLKEDIEKILEQFKKINGVEGYAFVREDGLPLITELDKNIDLINLCSSCAAMNENGKKMSGYNTIIIEYSEGNNLIVKKTDDETLLVCLTTKNANLSEILQEMKRINTEIVKIM